METTKEIRETLRQMAWCRAKGELKGLLYTFHNEREAFEKADRVIEKFITEIEDNSSWL